MGTSLWTQIRHKLGLRRSARNVEARVNKVMDKQTAAEMDASQGRSLKRLINELEMLKVAVNRPNNTPLHKRRTTDERGNANVR